MSARCILTTRATGLRAAILICGLCVLGAQPMKAVAQPSGLEDVPEPPPMPARVESGTTLEPDVTILEDQDQRVEQYSVNGRIYAIKVTPRRGVPYYLVDTDGDGEMESRRNALDADILIPQWVLFRW